MNENDHPITTIKSRTAWKCPYYHIQQDIIQLPDGTQGEYNIVNSPEAVFVVPVTNDGRLILVKNYRYTLKQWVWEVPAGAIKTSQSADDTAHAELLEEIGGTTQHLQFLMRASTMNGIGNNYANFFIAHDVTLSEPKHEPAEVMTIHVLSIEEVYQMVYSGQMNDVSSMMALLLARPHLKVYL
ncbi:MAG: NUDIX hydrolase [Chloroflexota bacterium]